MALAILVVFGLSVTNPALDQPQEEMAKKLANRIWSKILVRKRRSPCAVGYQI